MSSSARAWMVAASIATVEALTDQGFARWNYTMRCLQQHVRNNIRSYSQAKRLSASTPNFKIIRDVHVEELEQSEESLKKVISAEKRSQKENMSSSTRAWMVAASIATVEALKDQGFARWNYTMRCIQQHAKNNIRSYSQAKRLSSSTPNLKINRDVEELKQSEESLKKVIAWMVAASTATVEALKDQGFARWNYTMRCLQQHVRNNIRSYSQTKRLSASTPNFKILSRDVHAEELKRSEESLKKVMWNYTMRRLQQHVRSNIRSYSQARRLSVSTPNFKISGHVHAEKLKQSDESLKKVIATRVASGGGACRSYIVAASMAAVEALKDQGFARWNYPLRTLHHRLTNKIKSSSFSLSSARSSTSAATAQMIMKTDNSIKKVMELDCYVKNSSTLFKIILLPTTQTISNASASYTDIPSGGERQVKKEGGHARGAAWSTWGLCSNERRIKLASGEPAIICPKAHKNNATHSQREREMSGGKKRRGCKFEAAFKSMQQKKTTDAETNCSNLKATADVGGDHHHRDHHRGIDGTAKRVERWRSEDQLEDHHKVYTLLQLIFWGPD
ncbi:hypothetical protein Cgig2_023408 [Carnegiea gigantea]|uniref:Uncharacterized protein n=1 Tax=Carnegiea gigantea TaxID=171969 RepID=A0A9Q1K4F8_9CARY|nr:hypothetical protein Cgig2_023408 [Carnegiea gigantea]